MSLEDLGRRLRRRRRRAAAGVGAAEDKPRAESATAVSPVEFKLDEDSRRRLDRAEATHPEVCKALRALDAHQQSAVLAEDDALLVEAQVGSGKTTVLLHRLLWLLTVRGVPADRVAVLTFTNKAAREIVERLESHDLAAASSKLRFVGTFHSVARELLSRSEALADHGFRPGFRILGEDEKLRMLDGIIEREKLNIRYRNRLEARLRRFEKGVVLFGVMKHEDELPRLVSLFEEEKRRCNRMDFDDLIRLGTKVLPTCEPPPTHVLVDELQDTDDEQLSFLAALRDRGAEVFAVGDPRQLIYSWRGGRADLFDRVEKAFGARRVGLPRNYRSTGAILQAARSVLGDAGRELVGVREDGARIRVACHHDPSQEGLYLVERLRALVQEGRDPEGMAILFRTRGQAEALRQALRKAELPFREPRLGGDRRHPVALWLRRLIACLLNPADDAAAGALLDDDHFGLLRDEGARDRQDRADLQARLREFGESLAGGDALSFEKLRAGLDLERLMRPTSSSHGEHMDLVGGLLPFALESSRPVEALATLADDLALGRGLESGGGETGVTLSTLHAAKGLEFDVVFLSGANLGLLPLAASFGDREAEAEERRLFFVGLTRARDLLEISWFRDPRRFHALGERSPYLDMIPEELTESVEDLREEDEGSPWKPGMRVRHAQYGEGEIVGVEDGQVLCRFARRGEKSFNALFCNLVPL